MQDIESQKNETQPEQKEVQLNVMFNWNGHSWDAYEALGLPAGSGMTEVKKAYEEEMAKMDEESQAFIHKAYEAICAHKSGR